MRDERAAATLLITHDLGLVAEVADRVAVMYAGRVVETGTVAQIFAAARHPYTRRCWPAGRAWRPGAVRCR